MDSNIDRGIQVSSENSLENEKKIKKIGGSTARTVNPICVHPCLGKPLKISPLKMTQTIVATLSLLKQFSFKNLAVKYIIRMLKRHLEYILFSPFVTIFKSTNISKNISEKLV